MREGNYQDLLHDYRAAIKVIADVAFAQLAYFHRRLLGISNEKWPFSLTVYWIYSAMISYNTIVYEAINSIIVHLAVTKYTRVWKMLGFKEWMALANFVISDFDGLAAIQKYYLIWLFEEKRSSVKRKH